MLPDSWFDGMGLGGWLVMGLFWVAFLGLAAWAVSVYRPVDRPAGGGEADAAGRRGSRLHRTFVAFPDPTSASGGTLVARCEERTMTTRWSVNITPAERVARVLIGLVGVVGGFWLLAGAPSALGSVLAVLLAVAGFDLVVTGLLGHCPLYQKLGHVPRSLRRTP